ncbi:DUF6754 domain-containing protein [candidate division CSSED10-310 bacterium]|uniref:DUF6754 domain-containing protein n=1 Tax=candidate division CSSED10-310 bacterium TaxID=2855610 RepID=A0ABV6YW36_UNCC1
MLSLFLILWTDFSLECVADETTETENPGVTEISPAKSIAPPKQVTAGDKPLDSGNRIVIKWQQSVSEAENTVIGYDVYRADSDQPGAYKKINKRIIGLRVNKFEDQRENKIGGNIVKNKTTYFYKVAAVAADGSSVFSPVVSAQASATFFNPRKKNTLVMLLVYIVILIYSIWAARAGKQTYIRRLAGIDAIEEAVGRATEMGKPVMYLCGLSDLSDVSTLAAINILSGVARKVAKYQSRLIIPSRDPMVMTVAQEVVKEAYLAEGRPDAYREDDIYYTTYDQFPYVASVDGIMLRDKPATNLYMGYYYAESLILAETGAAAGAIQIAGTDAVTQLPFFVTACDYTLLGEELYAASAYISENPLLIGSLKGQDYMKFLLGVIILVGIIFITLSGIQPSLSYLQTIADLFQPLTSGS